MQLYRPVGVAELALIAAAGYTAFPPRLPFQPIFYPVLNCEYAVQIAERWNTRDRASDYAGFVTVFHIDAEFVARYPVRRAGATRHQELWVPAEELAEFNAHIVGQISIRAAFYGEHFAGVVDPITQLPAAIVAQHGGPRQAAPPSLYKKL